MRRLLLFTLTLLLAVPASALILDSGDGQGNTSPPVSDPGWSHVGRIGGPAGIYLGNGWVLTANHVIVVDPEFQSVIYPVVPGSVVQLQNPNSTPTPLADLKVFRINPSPSLGLLRIRASTPTTNTNVTFVSRGLTRGAVSTWGPGGYLWETNTGGMRWGTNKIAAPTIPPLPPYPDTLTFRTDFTKIIGGGGTTNEAQGANSDSGGAVFIKNGTTWELAGVMIAIRTFVGQPPDSSIYGNLTECADLAQYRTQLIALTRPQCANEVDDDGDSLTDWPADPGCASELDNSELPDQDQDGVDDPFDNCLVRPNPDQRDTNQDGYGNLCDADFDNDGGTGGSDFALLKAVFGTTLGQPAFDPDMDLDGNGAVGGSDFALLRSLFGAAPGPSGLACAGTSPCP